ncbi:protein max isoform 2-T2 [Synchiropus picturatus]
MLALAASKPPVCVRSVLLTPPVAWLAHPHHTHTHTHTHMLFSSSEFSESVRSVGYNCTFCSVFLQEESPRYHSVADKRAHHNALERKRRDHIKDSFHSLRDSVPALQGEKASRAQILDKATEYIQYMRRKNLTHQQDIDDLKRQNALLEQQVRALEKVKGSAQLQTNYSSSDSSLYTNPKGSAVSAFDGGSDSSSESEPEEPPSRKKPRVEAS